MKQLRNGLIIFWIVFVLLITAMGLTKNVYTGGLMNQGRTKDMVVFLSNFIYNLRLQFFLKIPQLVPANETDKDGFTYSKTADIHNDFLLISVWDNSEKTSVIKIVSIKDGSCIFQWKPFIPELNSIFNENCDDLIDNKLSVNTTRLRHPLVTEEGSVIFSAGLLYKIDRDSKLAWNSKIISHHSLEFDADSNLWLCSNNPDRSIANKFCIIDHAIAKVSPSDGKVLFLKSVFEILMENGFNRSDFFVGSYVSNIEYYQDYVHLNDVQPVFFDSKYWKKGDLFLSLRSQNLVLLYRPSTNKVLWWKRGPWLKQHDVIVIDSTRIGIFGNNMLEGHFNKPGDNLIDGSNVEYFYDFESGKITTPYDEFFKKAGIDTRIEGRAMPFPNGEIFVEETSNGRLWFGNAKELIWSYVVKANENNLTMFNWCRYMTKEEFEKLTFLKQEKY